MPPPSSLETVIELLKGVSDKVEGLSRKVTETQESIMIIGETLNTLSDRVGKIEERLDGVEGRLDNVEKEVVLVKNQVEVLGRSAETAQDDMLNEIHKVGERVSIMEIQQRANMAQAVAYSQFSAHPQIAVHSSSSSRNQTRVRGIF